MPPTLVCVPCFSGAPWDAAAFPMFRPRALLTPALPPGLARMEGYADWLERLVGGLREFVLVGDSFGAAVALALAARRPPGLRAVVASGGFARNPLRSAWLERVIRGRLRPRGRLYRYGVLWWHARLLASPYDGSGDHPWGPGNTWRLFAAHTPAADYWARARAAVDADLTAGLGRIAVPVLLLNPQDERLIAPRAAVAPSAIPGARTAVVPVAGHLFRYSHPAAYGAAVVTFLEGLGL